MPADLVVVGLGYVGLPLAQEATRAGLRVAGVDRAPHVVAGLTAGRSHVDDLSGDDVKAMLEAGFVASGDAGVVAGAGAVVICVPTPLSADGGPDLSAVLAAGAAVAGGLRAGCLVVLESTTYPGTTADVLRPVLEAGSGLVAGRDFALAFSPERIDPGNPVWGFRNTPKVVGGFTPACRDRAVRFYARLVDTVVPAGGLREAEMAKLLENTYRHVNIALVNEMAVFCHELGIDLWDAIRCAASKPFGFAPFWPGPGVGGHCIPIDPNYLSYAVRASLQRPFRFVELAQEINAAMPGYTVTRVQDALNDAGKAVRGSRVLLLGVTYKPDIADQRESPARPVAQRLLTLGADLSYHDPYVPTWAPAPGRDPLRSEPDLPTALATADLTVLLQAHTAYDPDELATTTRLLLDTRGSVPAGPRVRFL